MGMPAMVVPEPEGDLWTIADLERLPDDGNRYETLHGELLVTPLPSNAHQGLAAELVYELIRWARQTEGFAVRAPGGVYISPTSWLEPDIAVYPVSRYSTVPWRDLPPPVLVVEVLSPSTRTRDRHRKRPAYLAHGVSEVWMVDRHQRRLERWTAASEFPTVVTDRLEWAPSESLPPLTLPLSALWGADEPMGE